MPATENLPTDIDVAQLGQFVERFVGDLGAVMHAATVLIGERLGLYRAMGDSEWLTPEQVADATGTHARYVREWLAAEAASGYAEYDPATQRFRLNPVQALVTTGRARIFDAPELLVGASLLAEVDMIAKAKDYPGSGYGLVTVFDALHDMGDPAGAAAHVRESLDRDGTWMIVEPFAHDRLEENLTPFGRVFYSASTTICLPVSRSQEVDAALGAQAGEARIREVVTAAGFARFRRAAETPFNLVLEARP